jgi:hypothetical protein
MKFGYHHCSQRQAPVTVPELGSLVIVATTVKRFIVRFLLVLLLFSLANLVSLFVRSDDLFTPDTPDAMTRFGCPLLVYQSGGPVGLDYFSRTALLVNIMIALVVSTVAAVCYDCIRQDVLRTLGFEIRDA